MTERRGGWEPIDVVLVIVTAAIVLGYCVYLADMYIRTGGHW